MKFGRVIRIVEFICYFGVRINTKFKVLTICVFSIVICLDYLKAVKNLLKMLRICLEGNISAKSRAKLTAISNVTFYPSSFSRAILTLFEILAVDSTLSIALHLR